MEQSCVFRARRCRVGGHILKQKVVDLVESRVPRSRPRSIAIVPGVITYLYILN